MSEQDTRTAGELRDLRGMVNRTILAGVTAGAFTGGQAVAELRSLLAEWEADSDPAGPEVLDARRGPVDHQCRGCWRYAGLNRGGHETYRCDSGRHSLIAAHVAAEHVCNPVACGYVPERSE